MYRAVTYLRATQFLLLSKTIFHPLDTPNNNDGIIHVPYFNPKNIYRAPFYLPSIIWPSKTPNYIFVLQIDCTFTIFPSRTMYFSQKLVHTSTYCSHPSSQLLFLLTFPPPKKKLSTITHPPIDITDFSYFNWLVPNLNQNFGVVVSWRTKSKNKKLTLWKLSKSYKP